MKEIVAIALNTFKEAIRNRILYFILVFAVILILLSGVLSELTYADRGKIIMSFGFTAINVFAAAIAVFVGVSLVYNELEKRTIYTIVSKPIGRWQFLLGKYFGLLLTVWVNIVVMTVVFLTMVHYYVMVADPTWHHAWFMTVGRAVGRGLVTPFWWNLYPETSVVMPVIAVTMLEMAMVTAFAVLFSSFSTPVLSMMFTVMLFVAGRLNEDIVRFCVTLQDRALKAALANQTPYTHELSPAYHFANWAAHVTPNLGVFHKVVEQAVFEHKVNLWHWSIPYGILYTIAVLALAIVIFQRRNFK
ncbi:MAG: ABC transporter permease [Candidatus Sumerlaeia bacterium]